MIKTRGLIFLFIITFLISFVSAVPPVTQVQQFNEGYTIQYPQDNILKVGEDYSFEFHIFNISTGQIITKGISCEFHLYETNGDHKFVGYDSIPSDNLDYSFNVTKGNFSENVANYYFVNCNSSILGGYASNILYITETGNTPATTGESIIYVILLLGMLIILGVLTYFSFTLEYFNKKELDEKTGEKIIRSVNKKKYIKLLCMIFAYGTFLWILNMFAGIINNFISLSGLSKMVTNAYLFFYVLSKPAIVVFLILTFINLWRDIILNKELIKYGKSFIK